MTSRDEDRFRPKVGPPKSRGSATRSPFAQRVLAEVARAGPPSRSGLLKSRKRGGARLGRGSVAARFAGGALTSRARRVVIKSRIVVFQGRGRQSTRDHKRYLEREGVDRQGGAGQLYDGSTDQADGDAFAERSAQDRHQFRFIVSPEDATAIDDLKSYTRELLKQMERDVGTRLDWVAVDHWDTDNPHTHILLRGKDERGQDLVLARDYISHGMRLRAAEVATQWLGPRTELEIRESLAREVSQERWTSLDRSIERQLHDGIADLRKFPLDAQSRFRHAKLIGRLDRLVEMGLAESTERGVWTVAPQAEATLRAMGERGDIIRTHQRAFSAGARDYAIFDATQPGARLTGRIAAKGLADELNERGYLIVDGVDGDAHYVALPPNADVAEFRTGSLVTVRGGADPRPADRTIRDLAENGVYRVDRHLAEARTHERNPEAFVQAHVRRLEALRRAGIVERVEEGVWRVPKYLIERGRAYDAKRTQGAVVELRSELPLKQQVRAMGATWLDRQLLSRSEVLAPKGFGAEVRQALAEREGFLVESGLAERRGQRMIFAQDLLTTLRARDVEQAARTIAAASGLMHRPVADGQPVSGVYSRSVALVSGRFAMLEDGVGFTLVPWRPFIGKRLGRPLSAIVRGEHVSWEFGKRRGIGL